MSVTTQIWLHKLIKGPATRESQSKSARRLLQLACRTGGVKLNAGHLALPGPELISLVDRNFGLEISITHCPQMVAIALGKGRLGLDCEAMGKARNWQGIANQFFTQEEANTIAIASPIERERAFLRHWVLKESYIKSIKGTVFSDLNRLTLTDLGETATVGRRDGDNTRWAWVGNFGECVLGISGSHTSPPELTFYESADGADKSSTLSDKEVRGSYVPVR